MVKLKTQYSTAKHTRLDDLHGICSSWEKTWMPSAPQFAVLACIPRRKRIGQLYEMSFAVSQVHFVISGMRPQHMNPRLRAGWNKRIICLSKVIFIGRHWANHANIAYWKWFQYIQHCGCKSVLVFSLAIFAQEYWLLHPIKVLI